MQKIGESAVMHEAVRCSAEDCSNGGVAYVFTRRSIVVGTDVRIRTMNSDSIYREAWYDGHRFVSLCARCQIAEFCARFSLQTASLFAPNSGPPKFGLG